MSGPADGPGFVYVMESAGLFKIGWSSQPRKRLAGMQTQSAVPVRLIGVIEGSKADEAAWHYFFRAKRHWGEWFRLTEEEVEHVLQESYGIDRC